MQLLTAILVALVVCIGIGYALGLHKKNDYIAKANIKEKFTKMNNKSNMITTENDLLDKFWANIKTEIKNKGIAISDQRPKQSRIKSELNVTRGCAGVFNNIIIDINNKFIDITLNVVTKNQMSDNTRVNISMLDSNKIKNILMTDDTQSEFLWHNNFNHNSGIGIQTLFSVRKEFDIYDIDRMDDAVKWVVNILTKYGNVFDKFIKKSD